MNKTLAYGIVPLSEVECRFLCIFLKFAFVFAVPAVCVRACLDAFACVFLCPVAPLAWCVSGVIPCPRATDQRGSADSFPAGVGLIKEPQTNPGSVIKTHIHSD